MPSVTSTALFVMAALGMASVAPTASAAPNNNNNRHNNRAPPNRKTVAPFIIDGKYELVQLTVLNRHGHRAPNGPYWRLCPNDRYNRKAYRGVGNEGLTEQGFREEYQMGQYLRKKYGKFIGDTYNSKQHYIRAVAEPRCIQSAMAAAQAFFPEGYGPSGLSPSRQQYPPVFADLESHEYLLDDLQCIPQIQSAVGKYVNTTGAAIMAEPSNVAALDELVKLCGTTPEAFASKRKDIAIKVMVDGVIFNHDMGLNVLNGRVKPQLFNHLRNYTNTLLQGKLYSTDEQKTFAASEFPNDMLRRFTLATKTPAKLSNAGLVLGYEEYVKFTYYVAHREELYGVSYFFDMDMQVPGYPKQELPTGSSMLYSLLRTGDSEENYQYFVKVDLWTPADGVFSLVPKSGCANKHLCTLEEFQKIHDDRVARTGNWEKLCNFERPSLDYIF